MKNKFIIHDLNVVRLDNILEVLMILISRVREKYKGKNITISHHIS